MFNKSDYPLIRAFLKAEATHYKWKNGIKGPEALEFRRRMFHELKKRLRKEMGLFGCNWIHIESLSNMGQTLYKLTLGPGKGWNWQSGDIALFLPSSPNGGIGASRIPDKKAY